MSMNRVYKFFLGAVGSLALVFFTGCGKQQASGGFFGGATGAILGAAFSDGRPEGALLGAAVGTALGSSVGAASDIEEQEAEHRREQREMQQKNNELKRRNQELEDKKIPFCHSCGAKSYKKNARFCVECGEQLVQPQRRVEKKRTVTRTTYLVLD